MPFPHSYYDYLDVYDGALGEKPRAGAFYIPKYGDTLSKISNRAYGGMISTLAGVQWINRSKWNRDAAKADAFRYRRTSTSCKSKIVNPDIALTTQGYKPGAWLALCPPYPLLWVPGKEGELPEHLAPPGEPPKPPPLTFAPIPAPSKRAGPGRKGAPVVSGRTVVGPGPTSPFYQGQGSAGQDVRGRRLAGIGEDVPWWLILLLLGGGGYLWYRSRKKRRK